MPFRLVPLAAGVLLAAFPAPAIAQSGGAAAPDSGGGHVFEQPSPKPATTTAARLRATIFIYDGHPGGIGITRRGYLAFEALVDDAHRLVSECPCEKGCPSCVQSPKCGNLNEPLSKLGSAQLMGRMLAA